MWGGWLLATGLTFSLMAGIFHAYYTVALAPAIGAVVGIGGRLLWQRRFQIWARLVLAATVAVTAAWATVLLDRSPDFLPWLRWAVLAAGLSAAVGLLVADRVGRSLLATVAALGIAAGLAAPAAYAVQTATTPHTGSIPTAGPAVAGGMGFPGGGPRQGGAFAGRRGGFPGGAGGFPPPTAGTATGGTATGGTATGGTAGGGTAGGLGRFGGFGRGGAGGLLEAANVSSKVAALLQQDASNYRGAAAAVGSNSAAGFQLAAQQPVMPIGGFNGSDPSPTLAEFQQYVADGDVHWFIGSGGVGGLRSDGGSDAGQRIAAWVAQHFTATTVDGVTLYDLSTPTS